MSKETLEEAAERFFPTNRKGSMWIPNVDEVANKYRQEGFNHGAKWQADRMYSEEEVRRMLFDLGDALFNNCQNGIEEGEPEKYFNVIIEQHKNK